MAVTTHDSPVAATAPGYVNLAEYTRHRELADRSEEVAAQRSENQLAAEQPNA